MASSTGVLRKRFKKRLKRNRTDLKDNIDPRNGLLDKLLERDILSDNQVEEMKLHNHTVNDMNDILLNFVIRFSQEKFDHFIKTLCDCDHEHIAEILHKTLVDSYKGHETGEDPQNNYDQHAPEAKQGTKRKKGECVYQSDNNRKRKQKHNKEMPHIDDFDSDGDTKLTWHSYEGNISDVQQLISEGADVNKPDKKGNTPLHRACRFNNLDVVKYLVDHKANLEEKDNEGCTPLHMACIKGHFDVVKFLTECEINLEPEDNWGKTPFHNACLCGHLAVVKHLVTCEVDIEHLDKDDRTALFDACRKGHIAIVRYLINRKVNIQQVDSLKKASVLLIAAEYGHIQCVKILISSGINKDYQDEYGYTALMLASALGHQEVVRYLLSLGVNRNLQTNKGDTALEIAKKTENEIVAKMLKNK